MKLIMDYEVAIKNIRSELKKYLEDKQLKSLVLGISGGIDSTLCALLAKPVCDELNIPLIGRSLPAKSNSGGENSRAKDIGELFCTEFKETKIQSIFNKLVDFHWDNYDVYPKEDDTKDAIRYGNMKARIRMILLYDLASATNGMVLSTDNYTELLLGFWTLHGDVGDYGMIQNLWKTEVYEMAEWIVENEYAISPNAKSAIRKVIDADATDGLGVSKTDLDQIMPGWEGNSRDGYAEVDRILTGFNMLLTEAAKTPNVIKAMQKLSDTPVIQRQLRTQFKRENPYNIPRYIIDPDSKYNN